MLFIIISSLLFCLWPSHFPPKTLTLFHHKTNKYKIPILPATNSLFIWVKLQYAVHFPINHHIHKYILWKRHTKKWKRSDSLFSKKRHCLKDLLGGLFLLSFKYRLMPWNKIHLGYFCTTFMFDRRLIIHFIKA